MKLIKKFKSQNFDNRDNSKVSFIIIHYTALKNCNVAIKYLCDKKNKVSSHYLISQSGKIYNLVEDKERAWHAGISYWDGNIDLNSKSIGIELDFSKYKKNNSFSTNIIAALIYLIKKLKKKYKIENHNILGHSDIAPFRKIDPGPKFPWYKLYDNNLVFNPCGKKDLNTKVLKNWFKKNNLLSNKKVFLFILSYLGYDTLGIRDNRYLLSKLIIAYQSHYIQNNISGKIDNKTLNFSINHFSKYILTKK
tara:strand:- start:65 stop:814 length:750 start_codon:yes stop_codon:yes gene_type:complete